jgi:hypothetical protein
MMFSVLQSENEDSMRKETAFNMEPKAYVLTLKKHENPI